MIRGFLLFLLILFTSSQVAFASNGRGIKLNKKALSEVSTSANQYALVIGINDYVYWPRLEYARSDAELLNEFLAERGFQVVTLTDREATRNKILSEINKFKDKNIHRLLVYFAGHGHTVENEYGEKGYLIPIEGRREAYDAISIPHGELKKAIKSLNAKHVLLVFDSCYSGLALTRSGGFDETLSGYLARVDQKESIQILTAGGKDDQAMEKDGHGLFTRFFVMAARGAADANNDGVLTASEINSWIAPIVDEQSGGEQTPMVGRLHGEGEFLFVNSKEILKTTSDVEKNWRTESHSLFQQIKNSNQPRKLTLSSKEPIFERILEIISPNTSLEAKSFILNTMNYGVEPVQFTSLEEKYSASRSDSRSKKADQEGERLYKSYRVSKSSKQLNDAIQSYLNALAYNPENAHAYSNLSLAYYRSKDFRYAVWAGLKSIEHTDHQGTIAASLYNIALCFQAEEKYEKALVFYLAALELRERNTKVYRIVKDRIEGLFDKVGTGGMSL